MPDRPTVREYDRLEALPSSAVALLEEESRRRFFNGLAWYRIFCDTCLEPRQEPVFYVVASAVEPSAQMVLPMIRPLGREGSHVSPYPLGASTRTAMTNYQSVGFAPVTSVAGTACQGLLEALASHLKTQRCSVVDLNHLDSAIPENDLLQAAFEKAGFRTHDYLDEPIVFDEVAGRSYAAFMKGLSSNLRGNLKRVRNKLNQLGKVRLEVVGGGPRLEAAIRDYETVQKASWKPDETFPEHVPAMIRAAADAGALRLGLLYVDDRPVGVDLYVVSGGEANGKKSHYDETMRNYNVGELRTAMMLEHLIDVEKVERINFGKTAAAYKLKWMKQQRPVHGFVAFNPESAYGQILRILYQSRTIGRQRLSELKRRFARSG